MLIANPGSVGHESATPLHRQPPDLGMPRFAKFDVDDEPIEGYKLVDFLGKGQYGEVWKALDLRSGKKIALKIIDLTHSSGALKELRALNQVKNLNHPNLVPIFTARLKDRKDREVSIEKAEEAKKNGALKELVIAMGLGEQSLAGRLKEINPDGTPPAERKGLPIDELVQYMEGAARGIDFLNRPDHGLESGDGPVIHCDIKPDNMMIVSGEIQIADCGVAIMITPDARQTRAAGSPAYSPPELTANKPGQGSDQYSLAVSYYELRTGSLPFDEEIGLGGIIIAHSQGDLDFSLVGDEERAVLKKATAIRPKERFESCLKFVRALAKASDAAASDRLQAATGSIPVMAPRIPAPEPTREVPAYSSPGASGPMAFPMDRPISTGRSGVVDFSFGAADDGRMQRPPSRAAMPGLGSEAAAGTDDPKETPRAEMPDDRGPVGRGGMPADPNDPMGGQIRGTVEMDPMIAAILGGKQSPPRRPEAPAAPPPPPTTILQPPPPRQLPGAPQPAGRNAIPADPNDPMGGRIRGTVEMDPTIEAIIKGSGPVKLPDLPLSPPAPTPPDRKADSKAKPRPPAPPAPKPPAASQSDPIWLQQATENQRKSGPVPEQRKSGPVGKKPPSDPRYTIQPGHEELPVNPAEEKTWVREALREEDIRRSGNLKKSGPVQADDWRGGQGDAYDGGKKGGSKVLILGLAAAIGVGGVVGGFLIFGRDGKKPDTTGGTDAISTTTPVVPSTATPVVTSTQVIPKVVPDADDARKKKIAEVTAFIDSAHERRDRAALVKIDGAPTEVLKALDAKYSDVAVKDIEKQNADQHGEVIAILQEAKGRSWKDETSRKAGFTGIVDAAVKKAAAFKDTAAKKTVVAIVADLPGGTGPAQTLAADTLKSLYEAIDGPQKKLEALAVPAADDAKPALTAVKAWLEDPLQKSVGTKLTGVPVAAVKVWYDARKDGAGAEDFKTYDAQIADAGKLPPMPAVFVNEYFRLAAARGMTLADLKATMTRAEGWPNLEPAAKEQIRGGYTAAVGRVVRAELAKDNADLKALADAVGDAATGWAGAVRAEYLLAEKKEPLTDDERGTLVKLRAGLRDSTEGVDPELAAYASFVSGLDGTGVAAAKAFADAYRDPKFRPAGATRKDRAVSVLIKASLASGRVKNWDNPYSGAPEATALWLKIADDLKDNKDAWVALNVALAGRNTAAAEAAAVRAMSLDTATIPNSESELAAARAFFTWRAEKLRSSKRDESSVAAAAGARVAYRLALFGLSTIRNNTDELNYIRDVVEPIRTRLIEPFAGGVKADDKKTAAKFALVTLCIEVLDPNNLFAAEMQPAAKGVGDAKKESAGAPEAQAKLRAAIVKADEVISALKPEQKSLADAVKADPELAEAVGCRAFLTLMGCSPYYGGLFKKDGTGAGTVAEAWKSLKADSAMAMAAGDISPLASYFGNITRAYAGMSELDVLRPVLYTCPSIQTVDKAGVAVVERSADAAFAAAAHRVTFGKRAAIDAYNLAFFLFKTGNQLAKLGVDKNRVEKYLDKAQAQSVRLTNEFAPWWAETLDQVDAYTIRGLVREDLAWLVGVKAADNYKQAEKDLREAAKIGSKETDPLTVLNIFRTRVRHSRYAEGPNPTDKVEDKDAIEKVAGDKAIVWKVQARYWLGVCYAVNKKPDEAEQYFSEAIDAAETAKDETSLEFALLATGFRVRLSANASKPEPLGSLATKATAILDREVKGPSGTGTQKLRDALPHYAFLPEYLTAKKAVAEKDNAAARIQFAAAYDKIFALVDENRMLIEEPFCIECLADELRSGATTDAGVLKQRKALLKKLLTKFSWSLTAAERQSFTALAGS